MAMKILNKIPKKHQIPFTPVFVENLSEILDLNNFESLQNPTNGQVPSYNSTTKEWENKTLSNVVLSINILKTDLETLKNNSELVPGVLYKITDWSSIEALFIIALSNNTLDSKAGSNNFPTDVIYINFNDVDSNNWFISYRKDPIKNLSTYYDWRTILFRRWDSAGGNGVFIYTTNQGGGSTHQDFYTFGNNINVVGAGFIPAIDGNGGDNEEIFLGEKSTNNIFGNSVFGISGGILITNSTFSNSCREFSIEGYADKIIAGLNCNNNNFKKGVDTLTLGDDFRFNNIENGISGINFTAGTLCKDAYTKNIFVRSDGSPQLSYIDNTNTIIYNTPNA